MSPLRPRISWVAVVVFYGAMVALASALSWWQLDRPPLRVLDERAPLWVAALAGVGLGAAVIAFTRVAEQRFVWARELSAALRELIGPLRTRDAAVMAVSSGVGEELLFRGFFLAWLLETGAANGWGGAGWTVASLVISSLVFGLAHYAPGERLSHWWRFGAVAGLLFGGVTLLTGDVVAAVVAHLTINYFNLLALSAESLE